MDYTSELKKKFEYEEIKEENMWKGVVTMLKFHATLYWDNV